MLATSTQNIPAGAVTLCETCHARPKFFDSASGKLHPYCGKSCASKAKTQLTQGSANVCNVCHVRPRYHDGIQLHPYCGKTCARNAKTVNAHSRQASATATPNLNSNTCHIAGCGAPQFSGSKYCGQTHKSLAETVCLMCRKAPKQGDRHFCSITCANEAQSKAVILLEVPEDHVTFKSVTSQFKASWRHASHCPAVKRVYKIVGLQSSLDQYEAYKQDVERRGQFVAAGRCAGNENRRWHGTKRECALGDNGQTQFCASPSCSLCCIINTSFDVSLWGKKTGWGRFGTGIYTSSTSSKSNDYSTNADSSSQLKAMLLNKVIVGKGFKKTRDDSSLKAPPAGFDSVLAEKGGSLNHDELVVYRNDAIRPSFLVMYDAK